MTIALRGSDMMATNATANLSIQQTLHAHFSLLPGYILCPVHKSYQPFQYCHTTVKECCGHWQ